MEVKMKVWEKQYRAHIHGEMNDRIDELKEKATNRTITKEENKEYERMKKIDENLIKVSNLLRFRRTLLDLKEMIEDELVRREPSKENNSKQEQALEDELKQLKQEREELTSKLKNPETSDADKEKYEKQLKTCKAKIDRNQLRYSMLATKKQKSEEKEVSKENQLEKMSSEELKAQYRKICIKISRCNFYAGKLMKGQNIESIKTMDEKKDWENGKYEIDIKKLKARAEQAKKIKENREIVKAAVRQDAEIAPIKDLKGKIASEVNRYMEEEPKFSRENEYEEELALAEVSKFDERHPRLAKIKNWLKDKFANFKNKFEKTIYEEEPEKEEVVEVIQEEPEEKKSNKHLDFVKTMQNMEEFEISEVAEKGHQEIMDDKLQKVAQRLLENQKNARGEADPAITKKLERMSNEQNQNNDEGRE